MRCCTKRARGRPFADLFNWGVAAHAEANDIIFHHLGESSCAECSSWSHNSLLHDTLIYWKLPYATRATNSRFPHSPKIGHRSKSVCIRRLNENSLGVNTILELSAQKRFSLSCGSKKRLNYRRSIKGRILQFHTASFGEWAALA